jgi:DNA replication protein DnaT
VAGDWIKFDTATIDKPEVWTLADALDRTPEAVIGHLLRFWVWADKQSRDGNAVVTQLSVLDRVANCTGFGEALLSTGWLTQGEGGVLDPQLRPPQREKRKETGAYQKPSGVTSDTLR